jgi:hypothetical protein
VPECTTLVEVAAEVSREVLEREGSAVGWWAEPAAAPVRRTLAAVTQVLDPYGLLGTEALRAALTDDTAAAEGSAR